MPLLRQGWRYDGTVVGSILGNLEIVYRDTILVHDHYPTAVAANCAGEQNKYWGMHGVLMKIRPNSATLIWLVTWCGCRYGQVDCLFVKPAQEAEVRKDMEDASAVGVTGTTFFFNGVLLSGVPVINPSPSSTRIGCALMKSTPQSLRSCMITAVSW